MSTAPTVREGNVNYKLTINQLVLGRWRGQIDAVDAIILAHIEGLVTSQHPKVVKYRIAGGYTWVKHADLLLDNPILDLKERALRDRLKKLQRIGILDGITSPYKAGGRMARYRFSRQWYYLEEYWKAHAAQEAAAFYGWPEAEGQPAAVRDQSRKAVNCRSTERQPAAGNPIDKPGTPGSASGDPDGPPADPAQEVVPRDRGRELLRQIGIDLERREDP